MDATVWAGGICAVAGGAHFISLAIAAARLRRSGRSSAGRVPQPAISLVRPVCGIENFSAETLGSSFRIDYPRYEVIFCVAEADDPAVPLLRGLIEAHPRRSARLLIGDDRIGPNPKLNNMAKGWEAARYAWIVVADSNVMMAPDSLHQLLARCTADTGIVCSMPIGSRPHNFWADLECAFLNTLQARFQYAGEALGFGFAQGKTILFRRRLVEENGGLAALANDVAEDAAATKLVRAADLKVRLVDVPFEQPLGWRAAGAVWARQVRWARLRRASFPWLFVPEICLGAWLPALIGTLVVVAGYGPEPAAAVLAAALPVWFGGELWLARIAGWHCSWRLVPALVLRDLLLPALWLTAWLGSDFVWRGNPMRATDVPTRRRRQPRPVAPSLRPGHRRLRAMPGPLSLRLGRRLKR